MSTTMKASEARKRFTEALNRVAYQKARIVLVRHGVPVAAIIPVEDLEAIERLEDESDIADARKALEEGKPRPFAKVRKSLGL